MELSPRFFCTFVGVSDITNIRDNYTENLFEIIHFAFFLALCLSLLQIYICSNFSE